MKQNTKVRPSITQLLTDLGSLTGSESKTRQKAPATLRCPQHPYYRGLNTPEDDCPHCRLLFAATLVQQARMAACRQVVELTTQSDMDRAKIVELRDTLLDTHEDLDAKTDELQRARAGEIGYHGAITRGPAWGSTYPEGRVQVHRAEANGQAVIAIRGEGKSSSVAYLSSIRGAQELARCLDHALNEPQ